MILVLDVERYVAMPDELRDVAHDYLHSIVGSAADAGVQISDRNGAPMPEVRAIEWHGEGWVTEGVAEGRPVVNDEVVWVRWSPPDPPPIKLAQYARVA